MANDLMLPGAIANGDLSTRQFYVVRLTGSTIAGGFEVGVTTALTQRPIGILTNDPNTSGQGAEVVLSGIVKAQYGDTITIGQALSFGTDGRVAPILIDSTDALSKRYVIGQALQAGTSGEVRYIDLQRPYIYASTG